MDFPITRQQFREWLEEKDPQAIIGQSYDQSKCPLATACQELDRRDIRVLYADWVIGPRKPYQRYRPLPRWAYAVREKVDRLSETPSDITAETVLNVLEEIPE